MRSKLILVTVFLSFLFLSCSFEVNASGFDQVLFERALQESREGDFSKALETWQEFIDISPNNGFAYSNRGNVRLALGDPEGAILDQQRAINLLPNEFDPRINKGIAEEALKKWDEAEADYNWILARDSQNSAALYNLGWVKGSQGNWIEASALFQKASISDSDFVRARFSKALADYQLNQLEKAEAEFRSISRKYPMFVDSRAALTALLWRKGLFGEAESNWSAVVGLNNRYLDQDWLLEYLRWPSDPIQDLVAFINLQRE